ncbi:MAG: 2Fe-2S iron-sulfur cluster-binding protein, partial [Candidatus Marinimicrobia bacterium]|nr:2Fe-2S iron-sulfur cluster-binding protein [Candidatus Neomarinimicrobiota bacterium]
MEDKEKVMTESTVRAPKSTTPSTIKTPENAGAIGATIKVTIDGKEVRVPMGTTILNAARMLGIKIPTLCNHDDLCISGVCRICVVEVEGMRTLQASCAYPISQPIVLHTHTRKVRKARRHIIDLLLSRH